MGNIEDGREDIQYNSNKSNLLNIEIYKLDFF